MTFVPDKITPIVRARRIALMRSCAPLFLLLALPGLAASQTAAPVGAAQQQAANSLNTSPAIDELQSRLQAAAAARDAGDPRDVARANNLVLALAFRKLGNVRVAESAFPQAADLYQRSLAWEDAAETHVGLAISALYANRPNDSLVEASKALLLDPKCARAFNIQGKAWMKKRDYRKAVDSLQRAVELQPDFESSYALGVSLLSLKDPGSAKKATQVFGMIVASMGDSGSLHVLFGHAYRDTEMQDDAIRELRKAVALDTRTPHAHYFLGLALLWKNEWTDTPEIRQEFVTELSNFPRDFLANYFLGYLDSNDRRYDEANLHLRAAADIDASWPEPWLFLGLNAYAQGDLPRSEAYLLKCIELTGKDESRGNYQVRRAYVTLGRILTTSGRADEAAPYLERAREFQKQSLCRLSPWIPRCRWIPQFSRAPASPKRPRKPPPPRKISSAQSWVQVSTTLPLPKPFAATFLPRSLIIRRPSAGILKCPVCSAISASPLFACKIIRNASEFFRKSWPTIPPTPWHAPCWAPPILASTITAKLRELSRPSANAPCTTPPSAILGLLHSPA